ncbi:MAG: ferritin [Candidatus Heimdallarchaeota archaeon]|nr:ferritin [Candidatus Heimdallarchaeota archaeon]MCK5049234.1 ferritin [Candidatus Heimdallarchaeota archaeon]
MASERMLKALNEQIQEEMFSAYLYLSMSADFEAKNLKGFAHWMKLQAQEELIHALKFFDFIPEVNGEVILLPIAQPQKTWETPLKAFEDAYEHEKHISGKINDLVTIALEDKDYATKTTLLDWFVSEQVEEEATASEIVQLLKMAGDSFQGIFMMDQKLAGRVIEAANEE